MNSNYEMLIGLTAPIGVDLSSVVKGLKTAISRFDYNFEIIEIANLIYPDSNSKGNSNNRDVIDGRGSKLPLFRQIVEKEIAEIEDKEITNHDIFAASLVLEIEQLRQKDSKQHKNTIYILDNLKHPEDIKALKRIYKQSFYTMGVTSSLSQRIDTKLALYTKANTDASDSAHLDSVIREVYEDYFETNDKYPNLVGKAYELSDFFINLNSNQVDDKKCDILIERFVDLICGAPIVTPTKDEHNMFMAYMYSLRSADLSRQVGSTIVNELNDVLAMGVNEVPQGGGGQYWADDNYLPHIESCDMGNYQDQRDFIRGGDINAEMKEGFYQEITKSLIEKFDISFKSDTANNDIEAELQKLLSKTSLKDLTEFGRVVHAEMSALMSATRNGISVKGMHMYCTTYPCHNCAKHIIASGIKKVQYIEPYPKSKALTSHSDAIYDPDSISLITKNEKASKDEVISEITTQYKNKTLNQKKNDNDKRVLFEPFSGIGPQRYIDLFSMSLGQGVKVKRKNGTKAIYLDRKNLSMPRVPVLLAQTRLNESHLFTNIAGNFETEKLNTSNNDTKDLVYKIVTSKIQSFISDFQGQLSTVDEKVDSYVQYWSNAHKYGYIKSIEGVGDNYRFDISSFISQGVTPQVDQKVRFKIKEEPGVKPCAIEVEFLNVEGTQINKKNERFESVVKVFDSQKGYGYLIAQNDKGKNYRFGTSDICADSKGKLKIGDKVSFDKVFEKGSVKIENISIV
jgi:deoxycytidylate deaminase/cold shock CspA family protein